MSTITEYSSIYRYFTTDLLTNTVIAEIPFTDVSYERAIKGAGKFSGTVPYVPETVPFNLYETTMPGKTGLYITRDGQCVWGGIIWSRSYSVETRTMTLQGSEFTSYLYHRNIWKTYTHDFAATITKATGTTTISLDISDYEFPIGSTVQVIFYEVGDFVYNGYYTVVTAPTANTCTISLPSLPDGTYLNCSVYVRVDTYDFIRQLLDTMFVDYTNIDFPNYEIEPGVSNNVPMVSYAVSSNVGTIVTSAEHGLILGQQFEIVNAGHTLNGLYEVTSIPNAFTVTFDIIAPNVGTTAIAANTQTVTYKQLSSYQAMLTTSTPHLFSDNDTVVVSGVDDPTLTYEVFNGTHTIDAVTPTTFTFVTAYVTDVLPVPVTGGTATVTPAISVKTYGPFPANSDIGMTYSDVGYSGKNLKNKTFRGYQLLSVGEELDKYSDNIDGFEYRIDCEYDPSTNSFTRQFVMIPIDFPNPPAPGEVSPISRFGADKLVFDYPGSIQELKIDESSENAATRFFIVGSTGDLGQDASQPYSVASSTELLAAGWPLLDAEESADQVSVSLTKDQVYVDTSSEEALQGYAERYLTEFRPPLADIQVTVNGSLSPKVGEYVPGDWCALNINDEFIRARLASDLEPRDTVIVRKIDSYTVKVQNTPTFPEVVTLNLISEWQVDTRG